MSGAKFLRNYGDEKAPLYLAKEVGEVLGLSRVRKTISAYDANLAKRNHEITFDEYRRNKPVKMRRKVTMLTQDGARKLICKARTQAPDWLLEQLCVTKHDTWFSSIEASIIDKIKNIFPDEKFVTQFSCECYRIDLYHPEKNIAIEIDEKNHAYYDQAAEQTRTKTINTILNPTWIRFNAADEQSFYRTFGEITTALYK